MRRSRAAFDVAASAMGGRRSSLRLWGAAWLFLALAWPALVRADDAHYQDFVIGDRAMGLGGAFGGIADDPSGLFYNPAGIADAKDQNLQVSTSLYGFERASIKDRIALPVPGVENLDIQFTDLIIIPASAGYVKTFGGKDENGEPFQAYGLSVMVPSFRSYSASQGDDFSSYTRRVTDRELWTGLGYGRRITPRLRLGLSAYYVLRSVVDTEDVAARDPLGAGDERFQTVANDISFINGNILAILGAKYQLTEHLSLGLALQSPSVQVHSEVNLRFSRAVSDPSAVAGQRSKLESLVINEASSETRHAPALRLGVAWSKPHKYTMSLDVSAHAPTAYTLIRLDEDVRKRLPFNPEVERRAVVNINTGAEFLLVREVSISGGFFTNFSTANPIPTTPTRDQPAHVDLYGLVMAIGYFSEHTLSRLGVQYSFGKGHDVIPERSDIDRALTSDQAFQRVDYFQSFFYVFLSSTFRY